jgi:orotate phosphoribosyltransferase
MDIKICKRVNNTKRNFLVLNPKQCKHVPSDPKEALNMFEDLILTTRDNYINENILVIGFAETATAIGLEVANLLECDYIQTTREYFDKDYIIFSEAHSHATEQRLYCTDFDKYDRVLFVEDEVTTGKTILSIVNILSLSYGVNKFGVFSILNGMTKKDFEPFDERNIPINYIEHIDNSKYSDIVENVSVNNKVKEVSDKKSDCSYGAILVNGLQNTRFITDMELYERNIKSVINDIMKGLHNSSVNLKENVLVLGTEEFMYPAIRFGIHLQQLGCKVKCHATTRSPIATSDIDGYPLNSGYKLSSVYDEERETYIYNLAKYDMVFVLTESIANNTGELIRALVESGNDNITLIKIGE